MYELQRYSKTFHYSDIEIVVTTHYPKMATAEWKNIETQISPVYHRIKNIEIQGKNTRSPIWQATKTMHDRAIGFLHLQSINILSA